MQILHRIIKKSLALFKKHYFAQVGIKKDWILHQGNYKDEILFQLINKSL